jgi:GNAT superfamily N-acetyltransferase
MKEEFAIGPIDFDRDEESLRSFLSEGDRRCLASSRPGVEAGDALLNVARHGNDVVGWCLVFLRYRDEYGLTPEPDGADYLSGNDAYLVNVEVRRHHRGNGIGSAIVASVEAAVLPTGKTRLWLHVAETNAGAQRFYERRGWVYEKTIDPPWKPLGNPSRVYHKELHMPRIQSWARERR